MSTPGELLEALGREARARLGGRDTATRVYRGRSVEELVPQIQRDLGSDAIILRRREGLTGGMFGFFQRAFVEIEAMPGAPGVDVYDETPEQEPAVPPVPAAPQYELPPAPAARLWEPPPPPPVKSPPIAAAPTYPTPAPAPVSPSPPPPTSTPEPASPPPEETQAGSYLQRPGGPGYEPHPPIRS